MVVGVYKRLATFAGVWCVVVALGACSGNKPESTVHIAQVTETPAPTPTATTTPSPAPMQELSLATPAIAAAAGKAYFPPPPPRESAPPANTVGVARLMAPQLGVDHYVEIDRIIDNAMESPRDGSYAVGFYPDFDRPGSGGNAIFSAHETWNHFQGPFYQLGLAKVGEEIAVVMADGKMFRYRVFSNTRYEVDSMPMAEILWPKKRPAGEEWLTLLTCGGRIVYDSSGFGEYLDRDVVVAKRIS